MTHQYVSTACEHAEHGGCRIVCKFCEATCLCRCHWDGIQNEHALNVIEIELAHRAPAAPKRKS